MQDSFRARRRSRGVELLQHARNMPSPKVPVRKQPA